ncbi:hypothetical protein FCH28_29680 [Streptomyces piniterrae]|uniref:Uncharacterized protein n=1 Tax=Streptomyces piniterrae TaxID=2571125 RepID=A0A4U0MUX0_9ACTN|nr:hypothetical protein [Streptomyces piniterrae]TJZ44516.1 hypothetical protein FCH28_29680 [Streptomyces piniterrae]
MYEMRAGAATTGTTGLTWHVMTKSGSMTESDSVGTTLCGRRLTTSLRPSADEDTATDRYCAPCMDTLRATLTNEGGGPSQRHRLSDLGEGMAGECAPA